MKTANRSTFNDEINQKKIDKVKSKIKNLSDSISKPTIVPETEPKVDYKN